jgi:hypothetical protein
VQRIAHGGPQLAQAVLSSPQSGGMDGGIFVSDTSLLALLVGQCMEHSV